MVAFKKARRVVCDRLTAPTDELKNLFIEMNEKDRRKALKNQYKQKEANNFLESLPMSVELFESLFDFLDEHIDKHTANNFSLSEQFCTANGIDFEHLRNWLIENGAGDDEEVLWNIEEQFESLNRLG